MNIFLSFIFLLSASLFSAPLRAEDKCIRIYYDSSADSLYAWMAEMYSINLSNLLGHFPDYQQIIMPLSKYKKGAIEDCQATFYIGSNFSAAIPEDFISDFTSTNKQVAWLGYGIWKVGAERLSNLFGYTYSHLTTLDKENLDELGQPTFYKFFPYKGEVFEKYGAFYRPPPNSGVPNVEDRTKFMAAFEMAVLMPDEEMNPQTKVLVWAKHNNNINPPVPYILQNKNRFYIADIPFSFMHEADRYMVFADILFDILNEKPRFTGKRPALFRIEDISSDTIWPLFNDLIKMLNEYRIPFQLALIPIFADPLGVTDAAGTINQYRPLTNDFTMMEMMKKVKKLGGDFVMHGVTHQYKNLRNPFNGLTGNDFEFWDAINNGPVPDDGLHFILDKLDLGWFFLNKAKIYPAIFEVPHYQASAYDYNVLSLVFDWTIGRIIYFQQNVTDKPESLPDALKYNEFGFLNSADRFSALEKMKVVSGRRFTGQIYPYESYGDWYGQRVLPENLGNIQAYLNDSVVATRTIKDLIKTVKRNRVLRDVWASLFFHSFYLDAFPRDGLGSYPGDTKDLRELIETILDNNYEFIDVRDFTQKNKKIIRPKTIFIRGDEANEFL